MGSLLALYSKDAHLVPKSKDLPDNIPFAKAKKLVVDVPVSDKGVIDCYIDDKFAMAVDLPGSDN